MRLTDIDLNLLVVFDAIFTDGNLTRAARRLHVTQPAMSHALARLRDSFGDPLFVRSGHLMLPTPFARGAIVPIRKALSTLERELLEQRAFDPATDARRFHVGIRDVLEAALLPPLVAALSEIAPAIDLVSVRVPTTDIDSELSAGTLDMVIDVPVPVGDDVLHLPIIEDRLVVVARKGHRALRKQLDLDAYLAQSHVLVSSRRRGPGIEDMALHRVGQRRRVALRCQNYSAACRVVAATDLLLTMPELYARRLISAAESRIVAFPLEVPAVATHLYWHASADSDPGSRFLRELVEKVAREHGSRSRARLQSRVAR
ncbi:MAG: LysR family transcriptional regulator [Polyangiaceae bacterium]|nr:LysR family transcriptional regulator [Polyangiaceae bacterium]